MDSTKLQQEIKHFSVSITLQDQKSIQMIENFFSDHAPHLLEKDAFIRELSYIIIRTLFEKRVSRVDNDHSVLDVLQIKRPISLEKIQQFNRFLQTQFDTSLTDEEVLLLILSSSK